MSDLSALSSGVSGIQRGLNQLNKSASEIASANQLSGEPGKDVSEPLIAMKEAQLQVKAAAKVIKTADDTLGSLLDVVA